MLVDFHVYVPFVLGTSIVDHLLVNSLTVFTALLEANIFLRVTVETYLCKGAEYEKYLVNILVDEKE